MMNIPTRKKAKMPSFHTHQSSNHTDDTYTAYSTPVNRKPGFNHYDPYNSSYTHTSVPSAYAQQKAYEDFIYEKNVKLMRQRELEEKGFLPIPSKTPVTCTPESKWHL